MGNNEVLATAEEVIKSTNKGKFGKKLLFLLGGAAGLALGGLYLSRKIKNNELEDDFEEDYEEEAEMLHNPDDETEEAEE